MLLRRLWIYSREDFNTSEFQSVKSAWERLLIENRYEYEVWRYIRFCLNNDANY